MREQKYIDKTSHKVNYTNKWNNVFVHEGEKIIYVPAYLRLIVKRIKDIDFEKLQSQMNVTMVLNTHTFGLPDNIRKHISQNIQMEVGRNQSLNLHTMEDINPEPYVVKSEKLTKSLQHSKNQLTETILLQKQSSYVLGDKFTIRYSFKAAIDPYVFFTPIEVVNVVLSIKLRPIRYKNWTICFNLMSRQEDVNQLTVKHILDYSVSAMNIGDSYCLANKKLAYEITHQPIHTTLTKLNKNIYNFLDVKREKKQGQIKREAYQSACYAHFHVPIYKNFANVMKFLYTIFIPLFVLSFITHGIFSATPQLDGRIAIIATILIAFIAMVPSIRSSIPPNPYITVAELLIYFQTLIQIICLTQSISISKQYKNVEDRAQFVRSYIPAQDPLYKASNSIFWIGTGLELLLIAMSGLVIRTCASNSLIQLKESIKIEKKVFLDWSRTSFSDIQKDQNYSSSSYKFYGEQQFKKIVNLIN